MLLKSIDNVQIIIYDGFLLIEADPKNIVEGHPLMNFNKNTDRVDNEIYDFQKSNTGGKELSV